MLKRILIITGLVIAGGGILWLLVAFGGKSNPKNLPPVTLVWWRVWEEEDAVAGIAAAYQALHPNVTIEYRKFRFEEYERALLEAWAKGEGPDIFSIPNTWVARYRDYITPLPGSVTIPRIETRRRLGIKPEQVIIESETPTITVDELGDQFVDVVPKDVVATVEGKSSIWGLPLALDTLALYYNKTLLAQAGISLPAATWETFVNQMAALTRQDSDTDAIVQSGAALGTAANIPRAADILSLLMFQNGALMSQTGADGSFRATFDQPAPSQPGFVPGVQALEFYTDFANPTKTVYTWNEAQPSAEEAFADGRVAYFFGYSYQRPTIQASGGALDFDVTEVPQVNATFKRNLANYWVETVFARSAAADWAWDLIGFATRAENVAPYLNATSKPTALRALIDPQREASPAIEPFIAQTLTAESWYRGADASGAEQAFADMIEASLTGEEGYQEAVTRAVQAINQLEVSP